MRRGCIGRPLVQRTPVVGRHAAFPPPTFGPVRLRKEEPAQRIGKARMALRQKCADAFRRPTRRPRPRHLRGAQMARSTQGRPLARGGPRDVASFPRATPTPWPRGFIPPVGVIGKQAGNASRVFPPVERGTDCCPRFFSHIPWGVVGQGLGNAGEAPAAVSHATTDGRVTDAQSVWLQVRATQGDSPSRCHRPSVPWRGGRPGDAVCWSAMPPGEGEALRH